MSLEQIALILRREIPADDLPLLRLRDDGAIVEYDRPQGDPGYRQVAVHRLGE